MDAIDHVKKIVAEAITTLSYEHQIILGLYYNQRLSFKEIAGLVGSKEHAVRRTYIQALTACLDYKHFRYLKPR